MLLYPGVMCKAQEELDNVVGRSRPPSFEDKTSLPYVYALVQEVLRWRPVTPLGAFTCFLSPDGSDSSPLSTHKAAPHRSTEVLCSLTARGAELTSAVYRTIGTKDSSSRREQSSSLTYGRSTATRTSFPTTMCSDPRGFLTRPMKMP